MQSHVGTQTSSPCGHTPGQPATASVRTKGMRAAEVRGRKGGATPATPLWPVFCAHPQASCLPPGPAYPPPKHTPDSPSLQPCPGLLGLPSSPGTSSFSQTVWPRCFLLSTLLWLLIALRSNAALYPDTGPCLWRLSWLVLCQPNWASECPDAWSNIIMRVSGKVFWVRRTFIWVGWVKQTALPDVGGPPLVS